MYCLVMNTIIIVCDSVNESCVQQEVPNYLQLGAMQESADEALCALSNTSYALQALGTSHTHMWA